MLSMYEWDFFFGAVSRTRGAKAVRGQSLLAVGGLVVGLVILIALGLGWEALWLWVVPGLVAATLLAFAFDWVPHHPHSVQGRYVDTRIVAFPMLTLPMLWQNYHLIHHLYPRIPFYRYGACFRELRPELESKGAPIRELS
jgi:fatty acid desaturase